MTPRHDPKPRGRAEPAGGYEGKTRFRPDAKADYAQYRDAAAGYVANLPENDRKGLREKPLDWSLGHPAYLSAMHQLLGALDLMQLPILGRIVEVGSGAGWATEILASLGYHVDCIEPSATMIEIAKARLAAHLGHHGIGYAVDKVSYRCATMEASDLPDGAADAILFFESFHHVVDEEAVLRKCLKALRPGGWLVILGDANWKPGNAEQEQAWALEMATYGTLESPFTHDYLLWLLEQQGFTDISRYHLVGKLVPVAREGEPVRNFAMLDANWVNLVSARKPTKGKAPPKS
jgi:SAM-dependent methyltransferase